MEFSQEMESMGNLEDESLVMPDRTFEELSELDKLTGILDEYVSLFKQTRKKHEARLHESKVHNAETHYKLDQELEAVRNENAETRKQLALKQTKAAQEKQNLVAANEKLSQVNTLKESLIRETAALEARVEEAKLKMGQRQDLKSIINAYRYFTGVTWELCNPEREGSTRGYVIAYDHERPELRLVEWNPEDLGSRERIWQTMRMH